MTDNVKGAGDPPSGPPWSVDLLADLHAGVLDPAESERLWPLVKTDPQAQAVLTALDEVTTGLGELSTAPVEPMPAQYAARLDAALATEARTSGLVTTAPQLVQPAPVVDLAAARKRRNRMAAWGVGVLTAAAAAVAITVVALPGNETGGTPSAEGGDTNTEAPGNVPPGNNDEGRPALRSTELGKAIGLLNGKTDYGPFGDAQGFKECLSKQGVPATNPVGASPVTLDGKEGVAALLGAGTEIGHFRVVVVDSSCSSVMANAEVP